MAPKSEPSNANIRVNKQSVIEVEFSTTKVGDLDHVAGEVCGEDSSGGEASQVTEEQRGRNGMSEKKVKDLVLGEGELGESTITRHEEGGIARELVVHHVDKHGEGEETGLLHLMGR